MSCIRLKKTKRLFAVALMIVSTAILPVFAQNNNRNDNVRAERTETPRVVAQDNDTDWGWLGLLGLLGLAGLLPKKRSIQVKGVRDQNENRPAN